MTTAAASGNLVKTIRYGPTFFRNLPFRAGPVNAFPWLQKRVVETFGLINRTGDPLSCARLGARKGAFERLRKAKSEAHAFGRARTSILASPGAGSSLL